MATISCANCQKAPPSITLKICAKCLSTSYCSRDCQKAHWKSHKPTCGKPSAPASFSWDSGRGPLTQPLTTPFARLINNTYLSALPELDVYTLLIDAYRLRVTDTTNFDGAARVKAELFAGSATSDPLRGLQRFLDLAAQAPNSSRILPAWWDETKRQACEQLAQGEGEMGSAERREWLNLRRRERLDKAAVVERYYGNRQFPMQLRILAETVYDRGVGGHNGAETLAMMMEMERQGGGSWHVPGAEPKPGGRGGGGMVMSMFDASGSMPGAR